MAFTITDATGNAKVYADKAAVLADSGVVTGSVAIDNTAPTVTAISVESNNATPTVAKAGNTVTYSLTFSEAVTVSAVTATTANNIVTAVTTDLDAQRLPMI